MKDVFGVGQTKKVPPRSAAAADQAGPSGRRRRNAAPRTGPSPAPQRTSANTQARRAVDALEAGRSSTAWLTGINEYGKQEVLTMGRGCRRAPPVSCYWANPAAMAVSRQTPRDPLEASSSKPQAIPMIDSALRTLEPGRAVRGQCRPPLQNAPRPAVVAAGRADSRGSGRFVVSGMGKSGNRPQDRCDDGVAGTPPPSSVHPAMRRHGDLGMINGRRRHQGAVVGRAKPRNYEELIDIRAVFRIGL